MTNEAIVIRNLSKTFKNVKALDRINLDIHFNEIFGLLGPNGSGKTTLLRILATLMSPDRHSNSLTSSTNDYVCRINGLELLKNQEDIRKISGYVPQQMALYIDLSAIDNLILFSTPYGFDKSSQMNRINELLKLVGLYERRHELVKTFSGGMQRRLSIVCALVHKPSILFLDEVTVGLDTSLRHEIWHIIEQLKKYSTIVITTHYIPEAEQYCSRVALMSTGKILDIGSPDKLIKKYPTASNLEEVMLMCEKGENHV